MKTTFVRWQALICACLLILSGSSVSFAETIADSGEDWSFDGTQGENNWSYGYYNLTLDEEESDGIYQPTDFIEFLNDASDFVDFDGANHWNGNSWRLYRDTDPNTGPWTSITQTGGHPNGTNSAEAFSVDEPRRDEHWTIRRWESTHAGEWTVSTSLAASNTNCGNGTTLSVFHNGTEVSSLSTNSGDPIETGIGVNLAVGDFLDLVLSPVGLDGGRADGCDGSTYSMTVSDDDPPEPPIPPLPALADSVADFSGVQGQDNWYYGYYDQREDVEERDGVYGVDDFIEFLNDGSDIISDDPEFEAWKDSPNHWNGSQWDILANAAPVSHGPWTQINATSAHPAANAQGDAEVHWAVRRWESETTGTITVEGMTGNTSANGDGTVSRILLDGEEIWSEITDGETIEFSFDVDVTIGQVLDFVVDSDGAENFTLDDPFTIDSINDGSDNTVFQIRILGDLVAGLPGDFNGDGEISAADMDALSAEVRAGTNGAAFDLTGDGVVDNADRMSWVADAAGTWLGDSNLDGEFNTGDFVSVFTAGEYEDGIAGNSGWATGDWNGDGEFDTSDLVVAFTEGGFEQGPRGAAAASVPEPSSIALICLGLAGLMNIRRRS